MDDENRLPTAVWVEAKLRNLNAQGIYYYIAHKGAYAGGMVLVKIVAPQGGCKLLTQQRDLDGTLSWTNALPEDIVEENKADAYIQRAIARDPDLWVIEVEDRTLNNPFEEKV